MKLAEYEILRASKGFAPLLLLDDVFEKLDEQRMHQLLSRVSGPGNGQLLLPTPIINGSANTWTTYRQITRSCHLHA